MALLTQPQKDAVLRRIQRRWSDERVQCNFVRSALVAALDAADAWMENNFNASTNQGYNQSLPAAFRNNTTLEQKGLLLMYVIMVKAGLSPEDI